MSRHVLTSAHTNMVSLPVAYLFPSLRHAPSPSLTHILARPQSHPSLHSGQRNDSKSFFPRYFRRRPKSTASFPPFNFLPFERRGGSERSPLESTRAFAHITNVGRLKHLFIHTVFPACASVRVGSASMKITCERLILLWRNGWGRAV